MLTWRNDNMSTRWTFIYAEVWLVIDHLQKNPQKHTAWVLWNLFCFCQNFQLMRRILFSREFMMRRLKSSYFSPLRATAFFWKRKISSSSFIFIGLFAGNIKNCEMFVMFSEGGWKRVEILWEDIAVGNKCWINLR